MIRYRYKEREADMNGRIRESKREKAGGREREKN